jgi:Xaa-Pro aminopeptidase
MMENGIDFVLIGAGSDMKYVFNYSHFQSERLAVFIIPSTGKVSYVGPRFEMPRFEHTGLNVFYELLPWEEWEDPVDLVKQAVGEGNLVVAVNDRHQGRFITRYLEEMPGIDLVSAFPVLGEMRMRKTQQEISYLVHLGKAIDKAWELALGLQYSGRRESELALDLIDIKRKVFKEFGSPTIQLPSRAGRPLSGINTASAHGGGGDRVMQKGEAILWECGGGSCMGYVGDKTRSAQIAPGTNEYKKIYEVVKETQRTAFEAVKPGVTCESVDLAGRKILAKHGLAEFCDHRIGHGLGMDGHEYPYIVKGNKRLIEPGMVFSIEPGVYLPGKWGIRIEDIIYVTEDGVESLYHSTKEYNTVL